MYHPHIGIEQHFQTIVNNEKLWDKEDRLLLAVSGGAVGFGRLLLVVVISDGRLVNFGVVRFDCGVTRVVSFDPCSGDAVGFGRLLLVVVISDE